jgi:hypothetical protein
MPGSWTSMTGSHLVQDHEDTASPSPRSCRRLISPLEDFASSEDGWSARSMTSSIDGIHKEDGLEGVRRSCLTTKPSSRKAKAKFVRWAKSDAQPSIHVYATPLNCDASQLRQKSILGKAKSMFLGENRGTKTKYIDNYTYVCGLSRMLHHSHGMDANIIEMF